MAMLGLDRNVLNQLAYQQAQRGAPQLGDRLSESLDFFGGMGQFYGAGGGGGPGLGGLYASDGTLWNGVSGVGAPGAFWTLYYWMQTAWFNRMQLFASRVAFYECPYAKIGLNLLTALVMREGFQYSSRKPTVHKRLQKWIKKNKWVERSVRAFRRERIDGNCYIRLFDDGQTVRFVDPDLIYGQSSPREDFYQGVLFDPEDDEDIVGYEVHDSPLKPAGDKTDVPADEMQHRADLEFGMKKGFGVLLPIFGDLFEADNFTLNMLGSAEVISKYALVEQIDGPPGAVDWYQGQIQATTNAANGPYGQNGTPLTQGGNVIPSELIPRKSLVRAGMNQKFTTPGTPAFDQFMKPHAATLQKISACLGLPAGVFSQDKSESGGWSSEIIHSSYEITMLQCLQARHIRQDLELLEKVGFDTEDIQVIAPEIASDKKAQVEQLKHALEVGACSLRTYCTKLGLDFDDERDQIKAEAADRAMMEILADRAALLDPRGEAQLVKDEDQNPQSEK